MARNLELRPGMRALSPLAPDVFVIHDDGRVTAYRVGIAMMEFESLDKALGRYQLRRDDLHEVAPR
jgi:hypothetical protein